MKNLKIDNVKINDSELLNIAIEASQAATQEILSYLSPTDIEFKTESTNPVTAADKAAEIAIKNILKKTRPDDGLIGEEGSDVKSKTGFRWVFDPLDGTVNYMYQIPHWAISVSCEEFDGAKWRPRIGVIYDVLRNETFSAIRNQGAFLNKSQIKVNKTKDFSKALISTEFSYDRQNRSYQAAILSKLLLEVRDIRSCGSSALDLCWVACGRWDGFYENELSIWDWSAGSLIVQEAGGLVTALGTGIVASSRPIHKKLNQLVKQ
jgi:myo-inositol-1(or 4)-monophosphatase